MSNFTRKSLTKLTREEIEKKILDRFPLLNDNKILHNYFASYDFHESEKDIVTFWREVLYYIYENLKESFAVTVEDIIDVTRIKNRRPVGLQNILVILLLIQINLINSGEFILLSDLKTEEYYRFNYPNLYRESWSSWIKNSISNTLSFYNKKNDKVFKDNEVFINKKLFHEHLDTLLDLVKNIYHTEDISVITIMDLKSHLNRNTVKLHLFRNIKIVI